MESPRAVACSWMTERQSSEMHSRRHRGFGSHLVSPSLPPFLHPTRGRGEQFPILHLSQTQLFHVGRKKVVSGCSGVGRGCSHPAHTMPNPMACAEPARTTLALRVPSTEAAAGADAFP